MREKHRTAWTTVEKQILANVLLQKVPMNEVAVRLRRTEEGVRRKASALGLCRPRLGGTEVAKENQHLVQERVEA